jgi:hypothetical protein
VTGVVAGLCCLPLAAIGFLWKGEAGQIPLGQELRAFVEGDYQVKAVCE